MTFSSILYLKSIGLTRFPALGQTGNSTFRPVTCSLPVWMAPVYKVLHTVPHNPSLPLEEVPLCRFAAHLSGSRAWRTIRSYLCALRFYQISAGLPDPLIATFPRLTYLLKGIHRSLPDHAHGRRLPITPEVL